MEVAIPLIALGGMYVISNQSSRKCNPNTINRNVNKNKENFDKKINLIEWSWPENELQRTLKVSNSSSVFNMFFVQTKQVFNMLFVPKQPVFNMFFLPKNMCLTGFWYLKAFCLHVYGT
jgi:hypothetical protein